MLIEFTVGNFASFKDPVTLSMAASKIRSKIKRLDDDNVITVDRDLSLLTSAAIYGPNASGKSNLVAAANFMRSFVRGSFKESRFDEGIRVERFRLSAEMDENPSLLEMVFLIDGQQYRYGFEANERRVTAEWLYSVPKAREIKLFERQGQEVFPNPSNAQAKEFRAINALLPKINPEQPLRSNALFLSVAAQNNGPVAQKILTWFGNMRFMSGLKDGSFRHFTLEMFDDPEQRARIIGLVHSLDVGIQDIEIRRQDREQALQEAPEPIRGLLEHFKESEVFEITAKHEKFNARGEVIGYETLVMGSQKVCRHRKAVLYDRPTAGYAG